GEDRRARAIARDRKWCNNSCASHFSWIARRRHPGRRTSPRTPAHDCATTWQNATARSQMKYIFVTAGVVSWLGKGLAAASLGTLLELRGLRVVFQKFEPYLNVDPGTMNPFQHGEVYVLNDGAETDLDLGHY